MEDYLETLITIMIGLGAFLISVLRKKSSNEPKSDSILENWVESGDSPFEEQTAENSRVFFEEPLDSENEIYEKYNNTDSEILKQTAMRETTSINDPPGQILFDQKVSEKSEKEFYNLMEQKKTKKKMKFDGKKAIIYSAIINRKQF
jgi:predicted RND superfamily exporter protein